jgi:nicotinate phosphoribosyltransferase
MKEMPIITSLLDLDFYKLTMGQLVFHRYPNVPVKFAFTNRTKKVRIAEFVDESDLRRELDHVRTLRFMDDELQYLRSAPGEHGRLFGGDYLQFLKNLQLPAYHLAEHEGTYKLEFPGAWAEVIYWETIALSIINELYFRALMSRLSEFEREVAYATGAIRLAEKIKILRGKPDIRFSDFGTRRRFSRAWQDYVVRTLAKELPVQCVGTSNVAMAMKHGLTPIGTFAHEMYMVMAGVMWGSDEDIRASHNKVLQDWWDEYGFGLSIALTDNYGTDFFFRDMTAEQARQWKGLRQDSGDPFDFGEKAVAFYQRHGIDPRQKTIVFSDGLDVETIVQLADYFAGRIQVAFGWGTNLTNDLGFDALSLIIKAIESCGHGVVKLSDNLAKALGAPEDVERFKRIFNYTLTTFQQVRY